MPFSLREIFSPSSNNQAPTAENSNNQQTAADNQNNGNNQNTGNENQSANDQQEDKNVSPLDSFKDLWQSNDNKENENNNNNTNDDQNQNGLEVTPEVLQKSLNNVDFSSALTEETLSKIAEGGEGATQAFASAMTEVAKQTMMQSILVSNKIAEKRIEAAKEEYSKNLPNDIRAQTTAFNAAQQHPVLKDPAIRPVVEATQDQLLKKFPQATPNEITEMTVNYLTSMGKLFGNKDDDSQSSSAPTEEDWEKFLQG